jgi:hypothetical protein
MGTLCGGDIQEGIVIAGTAGRSLILWFILRPGILQCTIQGFRKMNEDERCNM